MDELPTPITRSEKFLAKAAGEDVTLPDPITREEVYLNAIANGGGGGGGSDLPEVTSADNGDLLGVVNGEWGKTDPPYSQSVDRTEIIAQQSVTTELRNGMYMGLMSGSLAEIPNGAKCVVTFNGDEYTLRYFLVDNMGIIGEMIDFTNYPFIIAEAGGDLVLITESAITANVKVELLTETSMLSSSFVNATQKSVIAFLRFTKTSNGAIGNLYSTNLTARELIAAVENDIPIFWVHHSGAIDDGGMGQEISPAQVYCEYVSGEYHFSFSDTPYSDNYVAPSLDDCPSKFDNGH